ncbi:MAG: GTPase ObgE [Planctomycetota bacterium]|nr:MAG: GTPase ObgE [Planctomycetota bacterium]
MFRDEAMLVANAGKGGDGCCSFAREKFRPLGGPDGGDGGDGGSVVLTADGHESSLFSVSRSSRVSARDGEPGGSSNCAGRKAPDVRVAVPVGTLVFDRARHNLLADLSVPGASVVVAQGGRGGRGNARFATSTDQAPRRFERGTPGEQRELRLELRLVADVGLVGLPNAGKSTLLSVLTAARPKIAAYPFTTLHPHLGMLETLPDGPVLVLADIPGLIAGAHTGKGLGHQFLRHLARTRLLLHLVDCSALAPDPAAAWSAVRAELAAYSPELAARPSLVAATKVEDEDAERRAADLEKATEQPVLRLSAVTRRGLDELRRRLAGELRERSAPAAASQ